MNLIKKILVPVDFSDYSKDALKYAVQFAKQFDAKLYIIYVIEPVIYPADFSMGQVAIPSLENDIKNRAEEEMDSLIKSYVDPSLETERIIKTGKPFVEIIETARDLDADIIIMATHGHTGVEHLLFGSTAEKVVRKAPCPVLTLRKPIKGFQFSAQNGQV
ncbi:uspa domain-containing protein [Melioribacter roseus P3M-2]|uniref:Universal stress protein n=1 Tax=Melioribacter roseus (strain DSM 23840 / JCM 17771 / VKM B-2668 / P3M-2) TaxID=1191523 RepID=I6ZA35_MELRP|nr:universal stress protein [Melioribacter roseus]AFN76000.1 uspa domain-containing protein [Melioribacter roseus P3M-2]